MPFPQDILQLLGGAQQQPQQSDMAQQILSARFEPTLQDASRAAYTSFVTDKPVVAQDYADQNVATAMKQLQNINQMNQQQTQLRLEAITADRQERQLQETVRHNQVSESRQGMLTPYQAAQLDLANRRLTMTEGTNSGLGKPPSGYRWSADGSGNLEPIPGGPGTAISAELSARLGLANKFLGESKGLKQEVAKGTATGPIDYIYGAAGYGNSGKIQRRIADGADALQRMLTGAGMPQSEAMDYSNRFRATIKDTDDTLTDKLTNLENVLKAQMEMATRGKGNISSPTAATAMPQAEDPRIAAARAAGYSDAEIQQYLMGVQ